MFGPPGCVLRHHALHSDAIYRAIGAVGDLVEVEVIFAPGLPAQSRVWLTAAAVRRMEVLENQLSGESAVQGGGSGAGDGAGAPSEPAPAA